MKTLVSQDDGAQPYRVHEEDQERLLAHINRYVRIINRLGSTMIRSGVPEEVVKQMITDV